MTTGRINQDANVLYMWFQALSMRKNAQNQQRTVHKDYSMCSINTISFYKVVTRSKIALYIKYKLTNYRQCLFIETHSIEQHIDLYHSFLPCISQVLLDALIVALVLKTLSLKTRPIVEKTPSASLYTVARSQSRSSRGLLHAFRFVYIAGPLCIACTTTWAQTLPKDPYHALVAPTKRADTQAEHRCLGLTLDLWTLKCLGLAQVKSLPQSKAPYATDMPAR